MFPMYLYKYNGLLSLITFMVLSCSATAEEPQRIMNPQEHYNGLITETEPLPSEYRQLSSAQGEVITVSYSTKEYADGTMAGRTNNACVYIPFGYDSNPEQRYNILYLVHGHYGTYSTYLSFDNGLLKNVLDNMIERGDIPPMIVVTPSYNYGQPTSNYVDADKYCEALTQELLNDLMPLIESRYRTFAENTDPIGLENSREHRAIGGFSMGGVTTWYAFEHLLPQIKYFIPISGDCWSLGTFAGMNRPRETAEYLAGVTKNNANKDFYIWAASGTNDSAYNETLVQIEAMADIQDIFNLSNLSFHEKSGARHEYGPTVEYLYNALPFFFAKDTDSSGISPTKKNPTSTDNVSYSIGGRRLRGDEKGIHIKNGKKIIIK